MFAELWGIADPEKLAGVERAAAVVQDGFDAMVAALRPGVATARPARRVRRPFAFAGVTTPAFEAVAAPFDGSSSTWLAPERALVGGERVVLARGRAAQRVGGVTRPDLRGRRAVRRTAARRPGGTSSSRRAHRARRSATLRARGADVHGVGRGVEPWPDELELVPGLIVAVELRDDTAVRQDIVHITDTHPTIVTQ